MKRALRILLWGMVFTVSSTFTSSCLYAAAGTTTADFLNIAVGARPAGLGEAFVAVADETSGMFYNPAGLALALSPEFQTMYSLWPGDVYYGFAGYTQPTFTGTYGLGLQYLSSAPTPKITDGVRGSDFNFYDGAANFLYATRMNETSAIGVNVRGIQSTLDGDTKSAVTGDAGLLFRTIEEGFSFGLAGQNLLPAKLGPDKLPMTLRAGMAFKASLPEQLSDVLFTVEAGVTDGLPAYYAVGLEHWGAGILGLRVGYKYVADEKQRQSMDTLSSWRAGLSLRIQSLSLDYSYQPFSSLGDAHRLSLSWRIFGWQMHWRTVPCEVKADPTIFSPNNDGAKDSVFFVPRVTEIRDVKNWELAIYDTSHNLVKKIPGKDVVPKIISWEGQTGDGEMVAEGKYYYSFTADGDAHKRARSSTGEIIADLTPPAASLQMSNSEIAPGTGLADTTTFYVSVNDFYGVDQWQLSLLNDRHKLVKVYKSTESVPVDFVWDGKDDYYGAVVPNGTYDVQLVAWDLAGNKTSVNSSIKVNVPPKVEIREVVKEVVREIQVKEERRGLVVNLSSQVLFPIGKPNLRPDAYGQLDEVVTLLQSYPDNDVLIEGYTDSTGSQQKNTELSSARAWTVYSYLVNKGISPAHLKPKGYGPDKPVASNRTMAGRAQNRRVEIIILKKG